ncbi:MAG: hypothetical protein ACOCVA_07700, partial [Prolixibacteraceae bacterium]
MEEKLHLIRYYEKIYKRELTPSEKELINCSFRKETVNKKELLFSSGQKNTRHYFIKKGLLRLYVI